MTNTFSRTVCSLRQLHNLRVIDLAQKCKVPAATIVEWEHGRTIPESAETIKHLAELLQVSSDFLLWKAKISHI